jgi:hypothetical protein
VLFVILKNNARISQFTSCKHIINCATKKMLVFTLKADEAERPLNGNNFEDPIRPRNLAIIRQPVPPSFLEKCPCRHKIDLGGGAVGLRHKSVLVALPINYVDSLRVSLNSFFLFHISVYSPSSPVAD